MNNTTPANILTAASWASSGAVGLIGNIVLVIILSKNLKKSKPYEKVIFATLLTDSCTCLTYGCLQPYAVLGRVTMLCKTAGFFVCLFMNMNQVWIAINMFSRYLALYHQKKYHQWFNIHGILLWYASVILVNIPVVVPLIYYDSFGLNNMGICAVNPINKITTMCALSGQVYPFISNIICIIFGYLIIKKIRVHVSQVTSNVDSSLVEESRQIVILVGISAIIPIMVQSPAYIIRLLQYFMIVNPWFSRVLMSFFPLMPASALFLTAFIIKPYRKRVVKFFTRGNKTMTTNIVKINVVNW